MKTQLTTEARADIADIRRYIARDNSPAAAKVVGSIRETLRDVISRHPLVGTACDEIAAGLRYFPVGSYVIFYRVDQSIIVVRVLHGARNASAIFRR
jgi:toxin ParE1/3/4